MLLTSHITVRPFTSYICQSCQGLKCWLTCCPSSQLSQTEVELDRKGETFQSCQAVSAEGEENTCGIKGPVRGAARMLTI